jgi:hypothetical protein
MLYHVLEDSVATADDLRKRLTPDESEAHILLTQSDAEESYEDYVRRIVAAPGVAGDLARTVKQADLLDNLRRCARDRDRPVTGMLRRRQDGALPQRPRVGACPSCSLTSR